MDTPLPTSRNVPAARRRVARGRLARWTVGLGAGATVGALGGAWWLVHSTAWAGPLLSDTVRSIVGPTVVARVQDFVYGIEDQVNLATRADEAPAAHWEVPPVDSATATAPSAAAPYEYRPRDVGPVHADHAAPGDGTWVAARVDDHEGPPLIYKTLLHPDPKRSWAEVFVTAIDLERTELHLVSGTLEPQATTVATRRWARSQGVIPETDRTRVVAAFNGGFKAQHGHYGMQIGEHRLLPPRDIGCTVARQSSGAMTIGTWSNLQSQADDFTWWRQTPPCMVEAGELHPGLRDDATTWGATLKGTTVIRRSAIGLSEDGQTLFVAVSNHTTAPAIATAMLHVGARSVAQLDVNWSHTRFVVFDEDHSERRTARGLFKGFVSEPGMYTQQSYTRDFFYVTRRPVAEAQR